MRLGKVAKSYTVGNVGGHGTGGDEDQTRP